MQTIVPYLWFDKEAKDAAEFYVAAFGNGSKVTSVSSGACETVSFKLLDYEFVAFSAGPADWKLNPSISFMVNFDASKDENALANLESTWAKLSEGGTPLMPLDKYFFSDRYGWIQDKFGVSWQLALSKPDDDPRPLIVPALMFTGDNTGKADEAIDFYVSVFKDSKRGMKSPYPEGQAPEKDAKLMYAEFVLNGQGFTAMDSGIMHKFTFNEAISLMVRCNDQAEIDHYWDNLSAVPDAESCGWLKDKYGVSWQIVPKSLGEMMGSEDKEKVSRVVEAFMKMKKFDVEALEKAFEGK